MRRLASGAGGATVWRLVFIVSGCSAVIWGRARCTLLALGGGACGHAVPHGTVNITQFRHVSDTLACYRGHAVFDSSQRWRPEAGSACPGSGGASSPARRSEERRVGAEGGSTCRYRGSTYTLKKKQTTN